MRKRAVAGLVSLLLFAAAGAQASEEQAQNIADARAGLLKVVGSYFGPVVAMARGQMPYDGATVEHSANRISQLLPMISDMFRTDTSGYDIETGALPGIWENPDDFADKTAAATAAAEALAAAAGDSQDAAMGAFRQLGGACKGCHDEYRQQD